MKNKATLNVNDKIFNLDVITGSENENALTSCPMPCSAGLSGWGPFRIGSACNEPEERIRNMPLSNPTKGKFLN